MKQLVVGLACVMLAAACQTGDSAPKTKPPKFDEARVTSAKIGGRDLRMYTYSARIDDNDNDIVAVRVVYSTGNEPFTKGAEGTTLNNPETREAEHIPPQNQVRYISATDKNSALEEYFDGSDDSKTAFYFDVDYTAPESDQVMTHKTIVYATDRSDIDRNNLATEIKD